MADEQLFLARFKQNHLGFFAGSAPLLEEEYFERYNFARLDWRALRMEIEKHHIPSATIHDLERLFAVVESFNFALMTSGHNYSHTMAVYKEQWNKIRELASQIKL
ncbi:MAG TPA: hypothetical protein VIJ46_05875 [Rhabdochlamydiaceae bacterium]